MEVCVLETLVNLVVKDIWLKKMISTASVDSKMLCSMILFCVYITKRAKALFFLCLDDFSYFTVALIDPVVTEKYFLVAL